MNVGRYDIIFGIIRPRRKVMPEFTWLALQWVLPRHSSRRTLHGPLRWRNRGNARSLVMVLASMGVYVRHGTDTEGDNECHESRHC